MTDFGKFGLHKFGSMFLALVLFVGAALMTTRGLQAFPLKYYAHRFGIIMARRARVKDSDWDKEERLKAIDADLDKFKKNVKNDKDLFVGQRKDILDILAKYDSKADKIKSPQVSHSELGKVVVPVGRTQFLRFADDVQQAELSRPVTITVSPARSAEELATNKFGLARSIELAIDVADEISKKDVIAARKFLISSVHKMVSGMAYDYGIWTEKSAEKYETMTFRELSNFLTSKVTVIKTEVVQAEAKLDKANLADAVVRLAEARAEREVEARAEREVEARAEKAWDAIISRLYRLGVALQLGRRKIIESVRQGFLDILPEKDHEVIKVALELIETAFKKTTLKSLGWDLRDRGFLGIGGKSALTKAHARMDAVLGFEMGKEALSNMGKLYVEEETKQVAERMLEAQQRMAAVLHRDVSRFITFKPVTSPHTSSPFRTPAASTSRPSTRPRTRSTPRAGSMSKSGH